jgi:hypothetical protein
MFYNPTLNTFLTEQDLVRMQIDPNSIYLEQNHGVTRLVDTPVPTAGDYQYVTELTPVPQLDDPMDPLSHVSYYRSYQ